MFRIMVIYDFGYSMELCSENVLILDEDRVRNKRGKSFSNEHHLINLRIRKRSIINSLTKFISRLISRNIGQNKL